MTHEKIVSLVALYRIRFEEAGIPKHRMDPAKTIKDLSDDEKLAHAHHLMDGILEYNADPEKSGKTNRHLAAAQMIMSAAGWYTLDELMNHNRP